MTPSPYRPSDTFFAYSSLAFIHGGQQVKLDPSAFVADPELIKALEKHPTPISCDTDHVLFNQGDHPKGLYILDRDRKSTRLNSSHLVISYAVFCLKKIIYLVNAFTPSEKVSLTTSAGITQETSYYNNLVNVVFF